MPRRFVRLLLVRHGEVDANVSYRFLGHRDDPLNATGREQAGALAHLFAALPIAVVYSSPLERARRTADAIAAAAGVAVREDPALLELDFGDWDGLTRSEILARRPADSELLGRWDADPTCPTPGGESLVALQERVARFADRLLADSPGTTVALVTHMGPIKVLLCAALGLPLEGARRLFLDPATVSVVDWSTAGASVLRLFNDHAHLGWRDARWLGLPPPAG